MKKYENFVAAFDNDLNTSLAITALYDVFKAKVNGATKIAVIKDFDRVLSLNLIEAAESLNDTSSNTGADDSEIEALIAERTKARAEKNWAKADEIRDKLNELNIVVKDTKDGIEWHRA